MVKAKYIQSALTAGLLAGLSVVMAGQGGTEVEPPPPPLASGEPLEPEVTIRERGKDTVYEYRINGRLVMVKVKPRIGPPYYFVDEDGDGELEYTTDDPMRGPGVNKWVIFRW